MRQHHRTSLTKTNQVQEGRTMSSNTSTTPTMSEGAVASMEREIERFRSEFGIDDETVIADMKAMFRSAYQWGRIAAQCEAFAAQVEEAFTAMAAS